MPKSLYSIFFDIISKQRFETGVVKAYVCSARSGE